MKARHIKAKVILVGYLALLAWPALLCSQTVLWSDDFEREDPTDTWTVDNGLWELGIPTTGPSPNLDGSRAHSGTNCAATSLSGNYPELASTRLVRILPFIVPATNQNPRLRFWTWHNLAVDGVDFGVVQVRVGNGLWEDASPRFVNGGLAWVRSSVDLTPYAGKSVQIAFYFFAGDGFGLSASVGPGWYVDDIALESGPYTLANPDSFENGYDDWFAETGLWEWGTPTSGPGSAHSGNSCMGTLLNGNYPEIGTGRLISPKFMVPDADQNPRLRFWTWHNLAVDGVDFGVVQVRVGNGAWQDASSRFGNGGLAWVRSSVDLKPYSGETIQVAFYFAGGDGFGLSPSIGPGWYVDDVALETGPEVFGIPDSFENGYGDWFAETGLWQWGQPTFGPGTAHGGDHCVGTLLASNYPEIGSGRLISPHFVVPPASTNPQLRFWHWFAFAGDGVDYGEVQIRVGTNSWSSLSSRYVGSGVGWSRPALDLRSFAGQTVQIAFNFFGGDGFGLNSSVGAGWYVDEVALQHDFGLLLLDAPIVRSQDPACISLGIAASTLIADVEFILSAPPGHLASLALDTDTCWTGTLTQQSGAEWLVRLQNSCTSIPAGVQTIGSICFTAVSAQSSFVPLNIDNLTAINQSGSTPVVKSFGSRTIVVANEALLEAFEGINGERTISVYGKPNFTYEIQRADDLNPPINWVPEWTNSVPAGMFRSTLLDGLRANDPVLYLRAKEK